MKNIILLAAIAIFCAHALYAQVPVDVDVAIREAASHLNRTLPEGSRLAVINIKSDHHKLSNYIIDQLIYTINQYNNLTVVERRDMNIIQKEIAFQLSGDVSDETMQSIGKMAGAQILISGEVIQFERRYQLMIKALTIETAVVQETIKQDIIINKKMETLTGTAQKLSLSFGGGIFVGGVFTEGTLDETSSAWVDIGSTAYNTQCNYVHHDSKSEFDIGTFAFADLQYAEVTMGIYYGAGRSHWSWNKDYYAYNNRIKVENDNGNNDFSLMALNIGLLGKYPFLINRNFTLFPLLGLEYHFSVLQIIDNKKATDNVSDNNALWLKTGGGVDFKFSDYLFLRGELLWGVKIYSKNEWDSSFSYFTHSPSLKIAIGFMP